MSAAVMLERFEDEDGFAGFRSPSLSAIGVPHVFTTRHGGGGGELDASRLGPDGARRLCLAAEARASRIVSIRQVHGNGVRVVDGTTETATGAEVMLEGAADALISQSPEWLLLIRVADCVPVLLASSEGSRVAAVHAGWRGIVAGVVPAALASFEGQSVCAAIGPCLSPARFEVGPEVARRFGLAGLGALVSAMGAGRPHVDLRGAVRHQLQAGGVEVIDDTDRCTWEHAGDFPSHRRDVTHGGQSRTGRLAAVIAARPTDRRPSPH